jgi:hypothetical protein
MTGMGLVQLARTDPTMGQVQPVTPMPQAAPTVGPQPTVQLPVTTPNSVVAQSPAVPQVGAGPEGAAFDANAELQRQRMNRPLNPNQPMRKTRNGAM